MDYCSYLISKAGKDNKALFRSIDRLLHKKAEKSFPTSSSAKDLANTFVIIFEDKITRIRSISIPPEIPEFFTSLDISTINCDLSNFSPISNSELSNIARSVVQKSCYLDPLTASLLKEHFDLFLPYSCYDRPTSHFTAAKPPLSVFKTTFCLLLIIGIVSCSCYLISPLYLTLLTMKYCSKD